METSVVASVLLAALGVALWEALEALEWAVVMEWAEEQWEALAVEPSVE
jgi:hypothetical protein